MARELQKADEAEDRQKPEVCLEKDRQPKRQHGEKIDDPFRARHESQPRPPRRQVMIRRVFRCDPDAQKIFDRERDERYGFNRPEEKPVAALDRRHRFQRDRRKIDDDQDHQKPVDDQGNALADRARLQNLVDGMTKRARSRLRGCSGRPPHASPRSDWRNSRIYAEPIASAIAFSAASAFEPSGPPACAMSARPPPPFPPRASAARRARSTALKRFTRSSVTPTTTPALPSALTPTIATTPERTCFLPSSARLLRSFISMPCTARARNLTSPIARAASSALLPPPPIAIFFLASESSRSSRLRSSIRLSSRAGTSCIGALICAATS